MAANRSSELERPLVRATVPLTLASTSDTGTKGNANSGNPFLSADGTKVTFYSLATNLGEGDTDSIADVYVKDLGGALTLASTSDTGTKGNNASAFQSLSADGARVAFASQASNLGEGDADSAYDVFVKDLATGALTLASTSDSGTKGNNNSVAPSLSADGTELAFDSTASNLGEGDTDTVDDVFVKALGGEAIPMAVDDAYATSAGTTLEVPAPGVLANDTDADAGDSLRAVLGTGPTHGTLVLAASGGFSYTPALGYVGPDSFTYRASDGAHSSAPATVTISVNPLNVAPVAQDDSFSTDEDTAVTVAPPGVLANDIDLNSDTLSAVEVTGPTHGTLDLGADGGFTYTPAANYNGPDSFTYQASDGSATSDPATVSLTVQPVNDAPVADAGADQTVDHNADFTLTGTGSDVDDDPLAYAWTQVSGPQASIRDPDQAETTVEGVPGSATLVFRLTVTDPSGATHTDDVTVTVSPK